VTKDEIRNVGDSIWFTNIYIQIHRIMSDFACKLKKKFFHGPGK